MKLSHSFSIIQSESVDALAWGVKVHFDSFLEALEFHKCKTCILVCSFCVSDSSLVRLDFVEFFLGFLFEGFGFPKSSNGFNLGLYLPRGVNWEKHIREINVQHGKAHNTIASIGDQ